MRGELCDCRSFLCGKKESSCKICCFAASDIGEPTACAWGRDRSSPRHVQEPRSYHSGDLFMLRVNRTISAFMDSAVVVSR